MLVQRNPLVDGMDEVGAEQFNPRGDVCHDMLEIEASVRTRHDNLAQLDVAGWAPREHPRSARAGKSGDGVATDAPRGLGVAGAVLNDAATVGRAGKNFVARA